MSIFRKTLEEYTIPGLICSVIYGLIMYWCNTSTPIIDALFFFIGFMTSSFFINRIQSNPDKEKADKNLKKYSLWFMVICGILLIILLITK